MPTGLKIGIAVGGLLLVLIGISAIGGSHNKSDSRADRGSAPSSAPTTKIPAAPGSAVRDGKFEFKVLDVGATKTVSSPDGNPYLTATAQGTFVVVTLSVKNTGNEQQTFFASNQKLIDSNGRQYGASSDADVSMNSAADAILTQINPGNSIQVKVAFDVPPGTTTRALELHDSVFSDGALLALPGKVG